MRVLVPSAIAAITILSAALFADGDAWTKSLKERSKRGTLHDAFQNVRGDSGRWNDAPDFLHAPPIAAKPAKTPLDDWLDQLQDEPDKPAGAKREDGPKREDDNWLLVRTRQLDDHDRVWVERIERRGNQFTVVLSEAVWRGRYAKNFTWYGVFGVNLGKLEPGKYEAKCIIQPLAFDKFEDPGTPANNWPKDERAADRKPVELKATFQVLAEAP